MNSKELAHKAAEILDNKKGEDIVIIEIGEKSSFADYLVIATGRSGRQVQALTDDVEGGLEKEGAICKGIEGKGGTGWVLLDMGDIIVNVFERETREKFNIEKVWGDCPVYNYEGTVEE